MIRKARPQAGYTLTEKISHFFKTFQQRIKNVAMLIKKPVVSFINRIKTVFGDEHKPVYKIYSRIKDANTFLSPKKFILPDVVVYFIAMFLFSFLVIALETIQFHVLMVVTSYLKATFIISIAMLGIALGSLIGFYLNRFNVHRVMFVSSVCLFFSIILAYYNIINIGVLGYPYLLVLPFVFASINISSIFAKGNSNTTYFINLAASALGVIFPIVFLPVFKSESSMMILMLVPIVFIFIQSFRISHLVVKGLFAIAVLIVIVQFTGTISNNVSTPDVISADIFENKIIAEFDKDVEKVEFRKNIPLEFFQRVYMVDKESGNYIFSGDEYDLKRADYFLKVLGFRERWGISQIPFLEKRTIVDSAEKLNKIFFEAELLPLLQKKYDTLFFRNYDLLFMQRVYTKQSDGNYHMTGDGYDAKRARYLLTQLGHMETIDLNFDVRYHASLLDERKIFTGSDRILLSEDSTLGRLEYTGQLAGGMEGVIPNKDEYYMYMNGVALDSIDAYNGSIKDPRVPWMTDSPKMFIVGLSADGIVKSCKRIKGAQVSGIEINPGIYHTMIEDGPFAYAAGYPYKDVEVYKGEGRGFLETTREQYDAIYLMNIHMEHGPISTLAPEYFHTIEGTQLLLNKITDRGYVVYEEIIDSFRSRLAMYKMMNTIKAAMRKRGIENPEKYIYIYKWGFSTYSDVFRTIIIKRTPFNMEEKKTLDSYIDTVTNKEPFSAYNVQMVFDPYGTRYGSDIEPFILDEIEYKEIFPNFLSSHEFQNKIMAKLDDPEDIRFMLSLYFYNRSYNRFELYTSRMNDADTYKLAQVLQKAEYSWHFDLRPATDDQPFPFNVHKEKYEVLEILRIVFLLSLLLIVPVFFLIINKSGHYKMNLFVPNLFMAATGFGYMLVEIVLMQKFQQFIGNPTYALIVTLGGLLLFSGIGSFVSRYFNKKLVIGLVALIPVILLIMLITLDGIFLAFGSMGFETKIFISALLLLPVTFLMGIPFPNALEIIRKNTSSEYGTLMFGVSGAFSTLGATSGIFLNVSYGYSMSFLAGTGCYAAGLVLFIILMLGKRKTA
ncbi:MAG: hypothetical protein JW904_13525 [Spirochaetales bacterium]|nr:hypothetical protein [Spirochaetales bacterium]